VGEYTVGVFPTVLTVMAGAALGGGIALGVTLIVIAAVIALVVLGATNAARSLQQLFS
jgi:galactitol-specific phosphotransferase system IIC component